MKETKKYIIVDLKTRLPLYGVKKRTMTFSTMEIAEEVAEQLFQGSSQYTCVYIPDLNIS